MVEIPRREPITGGRHAIWTQTFKDITNPCVRGEAWCAKRQALIQSIKAMNMRSGLSLGQRDWQVDAAAHVLMGYDVSVITATCDGKSFCYQLISMLEGDRTMLVVCPLIALMIGQVGCIYDVVRAVQCALQCAVWLTCLQVLANLGLEISACRLNSDEVRSNPRIIDDVVRGLYRIVFICPEFIDPTDKTFMRIIGLGTKPCIFAQRLCCLVVDEAHLVYVWRNFR